MSGISRRKTWFWIGIFALWLVPAFPLYYLGIDWLRTAHDPSRVENSPVARYIKASSPATSFPTETRAPQLANPTGDVGVSVGYSQSLQLDSSGGPFTTVNKSARTASYFDSSPQPQKAGDPPRPVRTVPYPSPYVGPAPNTAASADTANKADSIITTTQNWGAPRSVASSRLATVEPAAATAQNIRPASPANTTAGSRSATIAPSAAVPAPKNSRPAQPAKPGADPRPTAAKPAVAAATAPPAWFDPVAGLLPFSPQRTAGASAPPAGSVTLAASAQPTVKAEEQACRERLRGRGFIRPELPCIEIEAIIKNLPAGGFTFNQPDLVYEDAPFSIVLALQTAEGQSIANLTRGLPGKLETVTAQFAGQVEATLRGLDFKIDPAGPQLRTTTSLAPVHWEWSVTPLNAGQKLLVVEVGVVLMIGPDRFPVQITTLRRDINVRVSALKLLRAVLADTGAVALALFGAAGTFIGIVSGWKPTQKAVKAVIRRSRPRRSARTRPPPKRRAPGDGLQR